MDQVVGTFPTPAVLGFKTVVPFISQIATLPPVSRHTMSLMPSALKSWVSVAGDIANTVPQPGGKPLVPGQFVELPPESVRP